MVFKIADGNTPDTNIPTFYIEEEAELLDIPDDAPVGTIVECNASDGFKMFMKNSSGEFNDIIGG